MNENRFIHFVDKNSKKLMDQIKMQLYYLIYDENNKKIDYKSMSLEKQNEIIKLKIELINLKKNEINEPKMVEIKFQGEVIEIDKKEYLGLQSLIKEINRDYNEQRKNNIQIDDLTLDYLLNIYINKIENGHVIEITLGGNKLSKVPNSLAKFKNLKILYLSNNKISDINNSCLDKLKMLEKLNISNNRIENVSKNFLSKFKKLKTLTISNNDIEKFEKGLFDSLIDLKILEFGNNPIEYLPDGVFDKLVNLEELEFGSTKIENVYNVVLVHNTMLRKFNIFGNKVHDLPEDFLKGLINLEELSMSFININKLPLKIFEDIKNVTVIWLSNNKLKKFPIELIEDLENLKKLYIDNNVFKNPEEIKKKIKEVFPNLNISI